jgi:hypothetical protein
VDSEKTKDEVIREMKPHQEVVSLLSVLVSERSNWKGLSQVIELGLRGYVQAVYQRWYSRSHMMFLRKLEELEDKHGDCPHKLRSYLSRQWRCRQVDQICSYHTLHDEPYNLEITPPEKGTELRKQYDQWKRRKVKPTEGDQP